MGAQANGPSLSLVSMKSASVQAIIRVLNEADVPHIVVGGLAVVAHGFGRYTGDLDLVVRLRPALIKKAFAALARLGYMPRVPITAEQFGDDKLRAKWIAEKGMAVLNFHSDRHRDTPIDIFVSEPFDFDLEYARARVEDVAPGVSVRIIALPTLIRLKRRTGRPQDLVDVHELELLHGAEGIDDAG